MTLTPSLPALDKCNGRAPCHHVDAEEFCRLAISSRRLSRLDDAGAGMRGLIDTDTGECFLIEESKLFDFSLR